MVYHIETVGVEYDRALCQRANDNIAARAAEGLLGPGLGPVPPRVLHANVLDVDFTVLNTSVRY